MRAHVSCDVDKIIVFGQDYYQFTYAVRRQKDEFFFSNDLQTPSKREKGWKRHSFEKERENYESHTLDARGRATHLNVLADSLRRSEHNTCEKKKKLNRQQADRKKKKIISEWEVATTSCKTNEKGLKRANGDRRSTPYTLNGCEHINILCAPRRISIKCRHIQTITLSHRHSTNLCAAPGLPDC